MLGTLVNAGAIFAGGLIGAIGKKALKESTAHTILQGIGLVVFLIGIQMSIVAEKILVVLIAIVLGALIGELVGIHKAMEQLGKKLEQQFSGHSLEAGFVTASILFCVGSMSILGPIQSGVEGVHTILFLKSTIDFVIALILATTLGVGVVLSSVSVLIFQGLMTLLASFLEPYMSEALMSDINAVGGLLVLTIAINMFVPDKIKTANFLPAILLVMAYHLIMSAI